jgi:hypothetical protein
MIDRSHLPKKDDRPTIAILTSKFKILTSKFSLQNSHFFSQAITKTIAPVFQLNQGDFLKHLSHGHLKRCLEVLKQ